MSLDWNILKVENYEELIDGNVEEIITQIIVFSTIDAGIGKITHENAEEFFIRVRSKEDCFGPSMFINSKGEKVSYKDVVRRVGLWTNATQLNKKEWNERAIGWMREKAHNSMMYEKERT